MASPLDPPSPYGYASNPNISRLIMMGGEERARAAERAGEMWANTIGNIGNTVAGAVQQHQEQQAEQKKQAKLAQRDAYVAQTIHDWDGVDHQGLATKLISALGPVQGVKMASDISAFSKSVGEKDPVKHLTGTVAGMRLIDEQSDEAVAANWPKARGVFQQTLDEAGVGVTLPDQWTPDLRPTLKSLRGTFEQKLGFKAQEAPKTPEQIRAEAFAKSEGEAAGKLSGAPPEPKQTLEDKAREAFVLSRAHAQGTDSVKPPKSPEDTKELAGYLSGLSRGDISISDVPAKFKGDVLDAAGKQGLDTRTEKKKQIDADAEAVITSLNQLEDQAKETMTATSGPGAIVSGAVGTALNKVGLSEKTRLWEAQSAKLAQMARQMGERGTLTDKDVTRVQALLPKLTDPVSVRDKKLKDVREILTAGLREKVSSRVKLDRAEAPKTVNSQAEVDALPAGTVFIDASDGKKYKKGS